MTIAPLVENSEENRDIFKKLYELAVDIQRFHTDERAGYIISAQLICHSGTICTCRYGNPLRWLETCRCGGFFPHLWDNG